MSILIGLNASKIKSFILIALAFLIEFIPSFIFFLIEKAKIITNVSSVSDAPNAPNVPNIPSVFNAPNVPNDNDDYSVVKQAILNKRITAKSLSYSGLRENFNIKDRKIAKMLRDRLNHEKIAKYDATNKMIIV